MDVRRHVAAIALFAVQLLQGVLPAVGASCERQVVAASTASVVDAVAAHHHHGAPVDPDGTPVPAPAQQHAPVACPMAMACTVTGVMTSAVAVSTVDVDIDVHRPLHVADWPISLDIAPEPPPPRG